MRYDPIIDPFGLPVQIMRFDCAAESTLQFSPNPGATPGTTLWGAFGEVLLEGFCLRRQGGRSLCGERGSVCLAPELCPGPWLYKPRSQLQNRDLARPVLLSSRDLESGRPTWEFRMEAVLWGRHAIAARELIVEILDQMGERGVNPEPDTSEPVRFEIVAIHAETPLTLAEGVESLRLLRPIRFRLDFETPFLVDTKRNGPRGRGFSLADILGGCAVDLAACDMEDRELPARSRQVAP